VLGLNGSGAAAAVPPFDYKDPRDLDLDLGSGYMAYSCVALTDLYLHTKFHWNRENFCGQMDPHWGFIGSSGRSRPKKVSKAEMFNNTS